MPSGVRRRKHERSSIPRNRVKKQKPKNKMPVKTHPIIAAQWNAKETMEQNYRRLGLTARLGKRAGGVEKKIDFSKLSDDEEEESDEEEEEAPLAPGEGRIVKQADGTVKIEYGPGVVEQASEETEEDQTKKPDTQPKTEVIEQLEALAATAQPNPRSQSEREQEWIETLVRTHGDNYRAMFLDKRLNRFQQTEGEIKRKIKKWQKTNSQNAAEN